MAYKSCSNCQYSDIPASDPPCMTCLNGDSSRPNWEAARPIPATTYNTQQLVLLRGIPGAGKTTLAGTIRALSEAAGEVWVTFEKDAWRGYGEERKYQHKYNENADHWCIGMTADALAKGKSVIVANTFSKLVYMFPYFQIASELRTRGHKITTTVCHVQGPIGRSVHSSDVDYQHYIAEWQDYNGEFKDV